MRVAIIGTGIAGLTAAHLLNTKHEVQVFEKNQVIGGHTATVDVELDGKKYSIDTGFIVFNDRTYPLFRALMRGLGVQWQDTEMSFSVKNSITGLEYNGHSLTTLFAQRRNFFKPSFYKFLAEIVRFNNKAKLTFEHSVANNTPLDDISLGEFVQELKLSDMFKNNYLFPMCAAIWSASLQETTQFPLGFFLRFFMNHGLLNIQDRPQWAVIKGGSRQYLGPLTKPFADKIHTNTSIQGVYRNTEGAVLRFANGTEQQFEHVVFACHSDEALALLDDPTAAEQKVLGGIPYQANEVVLHTDVSQLPVRRAAWASWNYLLSAEQNSHTLPTSLTYNMNILQGLPLPKANTPEPVFCVTLNNTKAIAKSKILRQFTYHHPVYSVASFAARKQRQHICGLQATHFCGAYWYNGFHEDGVRSANDLAERFGVAAIKPEAQDLPQYG
ncbi:NAD(P)/FAD-dependent oxidoreductase [Aliidiomarina quisquiliarum]|uniref:NAD(P)/FAD-dependent oxidoreductase n=1 Tax=Aliidiomarina quisquiliarum TaxID=2938947 RepID=UPI00208F73B9|nr:FAD-dependent oxidoreductase [Aliidiomarina quisquiliarum]MCO4320884.1 FAD-dependent oxidoreductase [Aliidiomarina quisquiliarum]